MIITLLNGAYAVPSQGELLDTTGSEFLDLLADSKGAPSLECPTKQDKLAGGGFVMAQYVDHATTKNLNALSPDSKTDVFVFDIDDMTDEEIADGFPLWSKHSTLVYSTWKHTYDKPRYRLLVELDEAVPNHKKEPFHSLYMGVAKALKVKADPKTLDRARLFFGPQHLPENRDESERYRFKGVPVCVKNIKPIKGAALVEPTFQATLARPTKKQLNSLSVKIQRSKKSRMRTIAAALDAILRKEAFAPVGSIHTTTLEVAFELTRSFRLDAVWFANEYLRPCWLQMSEKTSYEQSLADWVHAVDSATAKHAEYEASVEAEAAALNEQLARKTAEFTSEELARAEGLKGKLIMCYRGGYYVYSPRCDAYKGPFKSSEVVVAVRDYICGVPGVQEFTISRGEMVLKSAIKMNHEYGSLADHVLFFAKQPIHPYEAESNTICLRAYKWMDWTPKFHEITDELLRIIGNDNYIQFEKYLTQFRSLDLCLPALTLVGPAGCWKSRICSLLSMFWTTKHGPSAGRAEKIMTRFNEHLVQNPVVWSDEQLACTSHGKPQPEAYRESITGLMQTVEFKAVSGLVQVKTAVRHVISVNDDAKVFSTEVDEDSILATMERFLLFYISGAKIAAFEKKWAGTTEMTQLREGRLLMEHIRWLEKNRNYESEGRLFVKPNTAAKVLMKARFAGEVLTYIWQVAFESLNNEKGFSVKGQLQRLPLICDDDGRLFLSPSRVQDLWNGAKSVAGSGVRKPTAQKIGTILAKSGFKLSSGDRATKNKGGGWEVDLNTLKAFIEVSELITWEELAYVCEKVFAKKLKDPA